MGPYIAHEFQSYDRIAFYRRFVNMFVILNTTELNGSFRIFDFQWVNCRWTIIWLWLSKRWEKQRAVWNVSKEEEEVKNVGVRSKCIMWNVQQARKLSSGSGIRLQFHFWHWYEWHISIKIMSNFWFHSSFFCIRCGFISCFVACMWLFITDK